MERRAIRQHQEGDMKTRLIFVFIFVGLLAGIGTAQTSPAGYQWKMTYLKGIDIGSVTPTISVDSNGRRFGGSTGCNIMDGTVNMRGSRISFKTVITSKRACTITTGKVEGGVLTMLEKVDRFQISHSRLRLYGQNTLLMELEPMVQPEPDEEQKPVADQINIEDRKWVLKSINGAPIPNVPQLAFIRFHSEKGSAGGDTSCNAFGADYTVEGDTISIT